MNKTSPLIWHPFTQMKQQDSFPKIIRGKDSRLQLENGEWIIDAISSWFVTLHGHANEEIGNAIATQAKLLEQVILTDFRHAPAMELTSELSSLLPSSLNKFFFSDNGSTTVEVALKMAIQYFYNQGVKKPDSFIVFEGAYHGDTVGAMSLSERSLFSTPFSPLLFPVTYLPYPVIHEFGAQIEDIERKILNDLKKILDKASDKYAAVIIEPLLQGVGGMRLCRKEFLKSLRQLLSQYNVFLIFDEVLTGFGRTGDYFALTKAETVPDILCLAKGLTGGFLPMGVTVTTEKIFKGFLNEDRKKTFFHGHSYCGNPLGCAAALASLRLLKKNAHQFQTMEKKHLRFLNELATHPKVMHPRALGTIAAFNLEEEKSNYLSPLGKRLQKFCLERKVFLRPFGNVVYLFPPLCITDEELKTIYDAILDFLHSPYTNCEK